MCFIRWYYPYRPAPISPTCDSPCPSCPLTLLHPTLLLSQLSRATMHHLSKPGKDGSSSGDSSSSGDDAETIRQMNAAIQSLSAQVRTKEDANAKGTLSLARRARERERERQPWTVGEENPTSTHALCAAPAARPAGKGKRHGVEKRVVLNVTSSRKETVLLCSALAPFAHTLLR